MSGWCGKKPLHLFDDVDYDFYISSHLFFERTSTMMMLCTTDSSNRASQNLKEEDLDLNRSDYEKEGKNQGKNILTLRVKILTLILTLQGKNSYPDSYPNSYPFS